VERTNKVTHWYDEGLPGTTSAHLILVEMWLREIDAKRVLLCGSGFWIVLIAGSGFHVVSLLLCKSTVSGFLLDNLFLIAVKSGGGIGDSSQDCS